MQDKPLLLVDIDGVISLFGFEPDKRPAGTWVQVEGIAHLLSTTAAQHLLDLETHYESVWCTGWEEKANDHLPHLLGIGPYPVIPLGHRGAPKKSLQGHWKLAAIDAYAGPERPLAWIDDFLDEACERWAASRPGPTLLVPTQPAEGLTAAQTLRLQDWAASTTGI
jgi:hypothetical protein